MTKHTPHSSSFFRARTKHSRWALPFLLGLAVFACTGGDGPTVTFDATPAVPDASIVYDAALCAGEVCDGVCVDTTSDPLNCGGCGETCASAGQICTGTTPCACPADFVPSEIGGGGFDQVEQQGDFFFAAAAGFASTLNVTAVIYDLTLELGTEYDLADALGTFTPPGAAAGYDVDVNNFTARTAYAATAGTIAFTNICAEGVSGTMTDVTFSEVQGLTIPTPIIGGCTMTYASLNFDIGTCPDLPGGP